MIFRHRKFISLTGLLFIISSQVFSQSGGSINIDSCFSWAKRHYPLMKQAELIQTVGDNNYDAVGASRLPQVSSNIKATYQSEVTSFDFPGFPSLVFPKDDYNFGLTVSQVIYDGGVSSQMQEMSIANTQAALEKNAVDLYQLKDKIARLYGGILIARENIVILQAYMNDISQRENKVRSQIQNGTMLQSNMDILEVEMLTTQQKVAEVNATLSGLYQTLSLYIDRTINENTELQPLESSSVVTDSIQRPEIRLFTAQQMALDAKLGLAKKQILPQLVFFADGAYGRPGYNFLDQSFRFYGIGGLTIRWNLTSVYNLSFEKKNYAANQSMIDVQRELFDMNIKSAVYTQQSEIEKWQQMIMTDQLIVEKRRTILSNAQNQLDNGLITSSDYLTELTAEKQAELNRELHKINLGMAELNLKITTGN